MTHAVIGQGALGSVLADALETAQHKVVRYSSRHTEKTALIDWSHPDLGEADWYWICIPDGQLGNFVKKTADQFSVDSFVLHLSGGMDLSVFQPVNNGTRTLASVHFLQTFTRFSTEHTFSEVPASILISDPSRFPLVENVISRIGANPFPVTQFEKAQIHAAAVFVSNFWILLAEMSDQLVRDALNKPAAAVFSRLMEVTLANIMKTGAAGNSPVTALSGPLLRGDAETIRTHISLLQSHHNYQNVYREISATGLELLKEAGMGTEKHEHIKHWLDGTQP